MTLLNHTTGHTPASATIRSTFGYFISRAGELVNRAVAAFIAQRERQANLVLLRTLDDRELRDIGLGRSEIEGGLAEAAAMRSRLQQAARR
jgi:uncharacterized protein YjiS (DUF1127 family)